MERYDVAVWVEKRKSDRRPMVTGTYFELEVAANSEKAARDMVRRAYPKGEIRSFAPALGGRITVKKHWLTVD